MYTCNSHIERERQRHTNILSRTLLKCFATKYMWVERVDTITYTQCVCVYLVEIADSGLLPEREAWKFNRLNITANLNCHRLYKWQGCECVCVCGAFLCFNVLWYILFSLSYISFICWLYSFCLNFSTLLREFFTKCVCARFVFAL